MKRGITIFLCLSLVLSLSFISAFSFSEFWNAITGRAIVDCIDSDGVCNNKENYQNCPQDCEKTSFGVLKVISLRYLADKWFLIIMGLCITIITIFIILLKKVGKGVTPQQESSAPI